MKCYIIEIELEPSFSYRVMRIKGEKRLAELISLHGKALTIIEEKEFEEERPIRVIKKKQLTVWDDIIRFLFK